MNYNGLIDLLAAHQADILCDSATKAIKELVRQVEYEQLCASELELQLADDYRGDGLEIEGKGVDQISADVCGQKSYGRSPTKRRAASQFARTV